MDNNGETLPTFGVITCTKEADDTVFFVVFPTPQQMNQHIARHSKSLTPVRQELLAGKLDSSHQNSRK